MATRVSFGNFYFESSKIDNITFPNITFTPDSSDSTNVQCLTAVVNHVTNKLDLTITDCLENHTIICRKVLFTKPDCSRPTTFMGKSAFAVMLDPSLKLQTKLSIAYKKAEMKDMMQRLNQSEAFRCQFHQLFVCAFLHKSALDSFSIITV